MRVYKAVNRRLQKMRCRRMVEISVRIFLIRLVESVRTTQQLGCRITLTCPVNKTIMIHITSEIKGKAVQMLDRTTLKEHRRM